jgi:hypothetical protein
LYGVEPAPHHRLIINRLVRVSRGEFNRLAIFMPPGSAKSTYGSILFPAWYLGQHPTHSILAASHTTELAEKWGRRVRNLLNERGPVLKLSVSEDNAAAGRWSVKQGGEYYSAGVGVGLLGFVRIWLLLTILCGRARTQIRRSFESVRGTGSRAI